MPPHGVYVEPFAGHGGVLRHKRPAARSSIAIDADPGLAGFWADWPWVEFHAGCGLAWLAEHGGRLGRDALVYCDPPYLFSVRAAPRARYAHELSDQDHRRLLGILRRMPCLVMVSGYRSQLYATGLADWRLVRFNAATRGGGRTEHLWCNFPAPQALHDYRYLGADYRERERIKRKVARWRAKAQGLSALERQAILSALLEVS